YVEDQIGGGDAVLPSGFPFAVVVETPPFVLRLLASGTRRLVHVEVTHITGSCAAAGRPPRLRSGLAAIPFPFVVGAGLSAFGAGLLSLAKMAAVSGVCAARQAVWLRGHS